MPARPEPQDSLGEGDQQADDHESVGHESVGSVAFEAARLAHVLAARAQAWSATKRSAESARDGEHEAFPHSDHWRTSDHEPDGPGPEPADPWSTADHWGATADEGTGHEQAWEHPGLGSAGSCAHCGCGSAPVCSACPICRAAGMVQLFSAPVLDAVADVISAGAMALREAATRQRQASNRQDSWPGSQDPWQGSGPTPWSEADTGVDPRAEDQADGFTTDHA